MPSTHTGRAHTLRERTGARASRPARAGATMHAYTRALASSLGPPPTEGASLRDEVLSPGSRHSCVPACGTAPGGSVETSLSKTVTAQKLLGAPKKSSGLAFRAGRLPAPCSPRASPRGAPCPGASPHRPGPRGVLPHLSHRPPPVRSRRTPPRATSTLPPTASQLERNPKYICAVVAARGAAERRSQVRPSRTCRRLAA